jgi:thiaminase/transcriptional activator TenA
MVKGLLTALTVSVLASGPAPAKDFSDEVWEQNQDIYQQILEHPFLTEMEDGSLSRAAFTFYLVQDAFYLGEFARALEATAAKAPKEAWKKLLMQHAQDSVQVERSMQENILKDYGISLEEQKRMEPAPEAFAYTSFLLATAHGRSFEESIAALLPCYWLYWEVGKELQKKGSKDPHYQQWIDAYASESYGETVKEVLSIANEVASQANPETVKNMKERFRRGSRYEWMFWDSAYAERAWPVP